jgi:hypothetical protein
MKWMMVVGACLLVLVLISAPLVMGGQMQMPTGGQGEQEQSTMGRGMMGMMCPMMGGQMDPSGMMSMMGMMGGGQMDSKAMGRMLELRGELFKAMGEVMIKHGQAMSREQ